MQTYPLPRGIPDFLVRHILPASILLALVIDDAGSDVRPGELALLDAVLLAPSHGWRGRERDETDNRS